MDPKNARSNTQRPPSPWVPTVRCPFKVHSPEYPEFERCGSFYEWSRFREHLLDRKHRTREMCPTCGEVFWDDIKYDEHTTATACEVNSRPEVGRRHFLSRHEDFLIRQLTGTVKGHRRTPSPSLEDLYRTVYSILFENDPHVPDRTSPEEIQHSTEGMGIDQRLQDARTGESSADAATTTFSYAGGVAERFLLVHDR